MWNYDFSSNLPFIYEFFLSIKFLVVNEIAHSFSVDVSEPFGSFTIFPFSVSFGAVAIHKISISMLCSIFPTAIIWFGTIWPCQFSYSVLHIVFESTNISRSSIIFFDKHSSYAFNLSIIKGTVVCPIFYHKFTFSMHNPYLFSANVGKNELPIVLPIRMNSRFK